MIKIIKKCKIFDKMNAKMHKMKFKLAKLVEMKGKTRFKKHQASVMRKMLSRSRPYFLAISIA